MEKLLISLLLIVFITPAYAEDRALLVGIDEYWYVGVSKGNKQDVKDMQQLAQSVWGYQSHQIRTLIDAQATRKNILDSFDNWLIKESRPGDKVLFYFSGHGYYVVDDNGDESDGYDETLCPVNTRGKKMMIRDDEINARLQRLKERKVTVIIDACHSDSMVPHFTTPTIKIPVFEIAAPHKDLKRTLAKDRIEQDGFIVALPNVIAYSAVAFNQVALIDTTVSPNRSVFTHRFVKGIQEKCADSNYDGKVTHVELLEYIRQESQKYCDNKPSQCKAGKLTPQLEAPPEILTTNVNTTAPLITTNSIEQAISVLTHKNEAQLQVKTLPQHHRFRVGEMIKLKITSNRGGYVLLFDVNGKGTLTRLFPNSSEQLEEKGYLKAGKTLILPDSPQDFNCMADKPLGKGILIALLVEDQLPYFFQNLPKAFEEIPAKQALTILQELRMTLNQTLQKENAANYPVRWSAAFFEYEVISATRKVK